MEFMKARATSLLLQVECFPPHKLTACARLRLSKLLRSELRFLRTLTDHTSPALNCTNLGYLEAVVQVVNHPDVDAVSAVLRTFKLPSSSHKAEEAFEAHVDIVCTFQTRPVWIVVSDRNPEYSFWVDEYPAKGWKSRTRSLVSVARSLCILQPVAVFFCFAKGMSNGLLRGFVSEFGAIKLDLFQEQKMVLHVDSESPCVEPQQSIFEVEEDDWVHICVSEGEAESLQRRQPVHPLIIGGSSVKSWVTLKVNIMGSSNESESRSCRLEELKQRSLINFFQCLKVSSKEEEPNAWAVGSDELIGHSPTLHESVYSGTDGCSDAFLSLVSIIGRHSTQSQSHTTPAPLVNLDTTALIALVSEVSNGAASLLVSLHDEDLISKFKSTAQFMKDQAKEELKAPLLKEMADILESRSPIICESVLNEFKSLVSLCGSFREKMRGEELLKVLRVVQDAPSARMMKLHETGRIRDKNKVIFGTGDFWLAPTLTANLSFVRAVRQTGMALSILEHKPRALVGDKCSYS